MKLYFGNAVTTVTTLLLAGLLAFIGCSVNHRASIQFWGRRMLFLAFYGLLICCFAAARDGLDKTIQCAIDGSCAPGIFSLVGIPTIVGCIGAAVIILCSVLCIFLKSQNARQVLFFMMSAGILGKILVVEASRILL